MTLGLEELLEERRRSHGDFKDAAVIAQSTKLLWRASKGWMKLTPVMREALENIAVKVGRVLAGDPRYQDHWRDISGYSQLVVTELTEGMANEGEQG
jgi:hypothetical protein